MTSMRSRTGAAVLSLTALSFAPAAAGSGAQREIPIEIMLYDTAPGRDVELSDPLAFGAAQVLGPRKLRAYVVRFELEPGERLLLARGLILDGATPRTVSNRPRFAAARMLGTLGYTLAMRGVPGDLTASVAPLAAMLFPGRRASTGSTRAGSRTLVLRGETMHQRDGYAAALIMLEANSLTRLEFTRVVTRPDGKKKRRARTQAILVQSGPRITKDELLQLLSGRPVETLIRNTQPQYRASVPRPQLPAPDLSELSLTARTKEDGFGPPEQ